MVDEKFKQYLIYVRNYLTDHNGINSPNSLHPFRSRYHHTIRVLHWCFRLAEGDPDIAKEVLYTAAIFHDIGYTDCDNAHHAVRSGKAFHEYAVGQGMEAGFREQVETLIYAHSNKALMQDQRIPRELLLLMEADLMDEEGAMGIVWDCMTLGNSHANSYGDAYYHIMENSNKPEPNPMVTELARQYWEEKKKIVSEFAKKLKEDLMIGSEYFEV